jgi:hypothetical protein
MADLVLVSANSAQWLSYPAYLACRKSHADHTAASQARATNANRQTDLAARAATLSRSKKLAA